MRLRTALSFCVSTVPLTRRRVSVEILLGHLPMVRGFATHSGEKDVIDSEKKARCAIVVRNSYSKSLYDFSFRCFGGKYSCAGVPFIAHRSGDSAFRFTRGSGA